MRKLVLKISGGVSFLVFLILLFAANNLGRTQDSQTMAERWSEKKDVAQISCFFSVNAGITEDRIKEFEHSIDSALSDASVVQESENPGARLWADAYSADGRIMLSSDRSHLEADAIGIGGDFFLFHPLKLLSGSYFSGNDLMQDYCIIDQDAAWQLFGSSNVAGMTVYIGGIPHMVIGVVERPEGRLEKAAGLDGTLVYVSYQTLSEHGSCNGINHYEIVMPDPVTGFAENFIREKLGTSEKETEVLENTSRYSFLSRLKLIPAFGTRSMNGRAIIYPYWENIARGYEDILAVVTLFELLFLLYAIVLALVFFGIWWKHKGWTLKDVWLYLKDKAERLGEKLRAKRLEKRRNPEGSTGEIRRKPKKKEKAGKKERAKKREEKDL
ncbi:MAG: ABC transporter permease [Acetatifactor sp.]|nr:ABC transporter permease [Acetatifactor sp.]